MELTSLHKLGFTKTAGPVWQLAKAAIPKLFQSGAKPLEVIKDTASTAANWLPKVEKMTPFKNTATNLLDRPMLGFTKKSPVGIFENMKRPGWVQSEVGEFADYGKSIFAKNPNRNIFQRTGDVMKSQLQNSQYYTKQVGSDVMVYERSALGKVISPLTQTGVGVGITTGAMATLPDGSPATTPRKVLTGVKDSILWGPLRPITGAVTLSELGFGAAKKIMS